MADDDDFVRITLRIPRKLHHDLNEAAAKKRSMNAEIIGRLEESFAHAVDASDAPPDWKDLVDMIQRSSSYMQRIERRVNQMMGVGDRFGYVKQKHIFMPSDDAKDDSTTD